MLLLLFVMLAAMPAQAQTVGGEALPPGAPPMPLCNAPRAGVAACLAGKQCVCGFERGGSITGRPDGWRWDCSALRPSCSTVPADSGGAAGAVPVFPQVTLPGPGGNAGVAPWR